MKFTPIVDKHVVLHDVAKKTHVNFDEPMDIVEKKKKRSHPAHDEETSKPKKQKSNKKEKTDKKEKSDKKDKKEKKDKKDKKEKKNVEVIKPVEVVKGKPPVTEKKSVTEKKPVTEKKKPIVEKKKPVTEKKSLTTKDEKKPVSITVGEPVKVRGPKFTPKKVKGIPYQAPKKLTEEEMKARVQAVRKKKLLKRQSKVKVNGEVVIKPLFQITPPEKVIPTKQLGEFVLYALSETTNLPWCSIINKAKIAKLVFVYAQGLNVGYFGGSKTPCVDLDQLKSEEWVGKASMPFLTKQSKYMIVNEISGRNGRFNSPVADILQCNMSNSKKERLTKEQTEKTELFKNNMREYYVLSLDDLRKADYPVPPFLDNTVVLPNGWKETHPSLKERKQGELKRIIGLDCEMVQTASGSTLARVTLIDEDGTKLLDEMVLPDEPIIDYLTKYSGITPEAMSNATCSFRRAQKHVRKLIDHNTILVGHGLENDLKALQIAHPYCVDTSLLYDHHRGPPYKPSLRFLARHYLKRHIQDRNEAHIGHDSAEDARATLDLFKLKLANKPNFGRFKRTELIMDRLLANRPPRDSAIIESSKNSYRSFGSSQGGDYFRVDTDEALVEMTVEKIKEKDFLFTRYQTADEDKLDTLEDEDEIVPSIVPSAASEDAERAIRLQTMDSYIKTIYNELPENSFIVVSGGVNNVPQYKELYDKHQRYQEKYGSKKLGSIEIPKDEQWTEENQKDLCKYAAEARMSSSFFIFKR